MGANHSKEHWKPDNLAPNCEKCAKPFTVSVRRHHCRNCGKVYCQSCSFRKAAVLARGITTEVRLCDACYFTIVTAPKGSPGNSFRGSSQQQGAGGNVGISGGGQRNASHTNLASIASDSSAAHSANNHHHVGGTNNNHATHVPQPAAVPTKRAVCDAIVKDASKVMIDASAIRAKETLADVEYTLYNPDLKAAVEGNDVCLPPGGCDTAEEVMAVLDGPARTAPSDALQRYADGVRAVVLAMCDTSALPEIVSPLNDLILSQDRLVATDSPPKTVAE
jgi:hypothetical protein